MRLNIGTGIGTDVNELEEKLRTHIELLRKCAGEKTILPGPEYGPERVGDLRSNLLDASLASNVLSWKPTHSLDEGLAATARWFFEREDALQ